jgi:tRNA-specific 2-thiouridylase
MSKQRIKTVALVSSGLDSLLAAKIIHNLDIEVQGVCFLFQFDNLEKKFRNGDIETFLKPFGIPLTVFDVSEEFLPVFLNPEHGYGKGVNPCIDCHLFMLRRAKAFMDEIGAHFLITGEVVGQRPMSQTKPTLFHIDKVSGLRGLILRPLSAKLLPPTLPEMEGWVDRNVLFDISGRSRKRQFELAEKLGITKYNSPAGGCILTDPNYARRVKAFFEHREKKEVTIEELKLLRLGRHFWPNTHLQVVVGRDEKDNIALEHFRRGRWVFYPANGKGPLVLAQGVRDESDHAVTAGITSRYCSGNKSSHQICSDRNGESREYIGVPVSDTELETWRV